MLPTLGQTVRPGCHSTLLKLEAKVLEADSEDREHGNVAANAIDGRSGHLLAHALGPKKTIPCRTIW